MRNGVSEKIELSKMKDISDLPKNITPNGLSPNQALKKMRSSAKTHNYKCIYHALFELSDELMCISFSNGHLIKVNKAFTDILGYSEEEMIGQSVLKFIHPDDVEPTLNAQNKVHHDGELNYFENRWIAKDGKHIRLEWSTKQFFEGYLSVARVKNEPNLYLSKVTHELRSPLNALIGFTSLLKMSDNLTDVERSYIENMEKSGNQLLKKINDISVLNNISKKGYTIENINLLSFITECCHQSSSLLEEKSLSITIHHSYLNNIVQIDTEALTSVVNNIISNAIKYNKQNGMIDINSVLVGNDICITIRDTGIGIRNDFMKNLFVPFKRDNPSIDGTGLGLSMVKNYTEMFRGIIDINSKFGEWTEVKLTFPLSDEVEINTTLQEDIIQLGLQEEKNKLIKIIYVEDDKTNIFLVEQFLKKIFGDRMVFKSATTASEGYKSIIRDPPDILLLDYHLPDYNGDELYKQLIKCDLLDKIGHMCVLSADSGVAKMDNMKLLGIKHYVLKPIIFQDFKDIMESFI